MKNKEQEVKGIGGWLLFPIFGMIVTILVNGFSLLETLAYYSFQEYYLLSILEIMFVAGAVMFLFGVFIKATWLRKYAIGLYGFICIANIALLSIPMFVGSFIWLMYFIKSKRVKNTFGE